VFGLLHVAEVHTEVDDAGGIYFVKRDTTVEGEL
jgi:hypothetical protein